MFCYFVSRIFQACLFSSHAYFKVSQFWEVLIFEPCLFSISAYYRENKKLPVIITKVFENSEIGEAAEQTRIRASFLLQSATFAREKVIKVLLGPLVWPQFLIISFNKGQKMHQGAKTGQVAFSRGQKPASAASKSDQPYLLGNAITKLATCFFQKRKKQTKNSRVQSKIVISYGVKKFKQNETFWLRNSGHGGNSLTGLGQSFSLDSQDAFTIQKILKHSQYKNDATQLKNLLV